MNARSALRQVQGDAGAGDGGSPLRETPPFPIQPGGVFPGVPAARSPDWWGALVYVPGSRFPEGVPGGCSPRFMAVVGAT